MSIERFDGERVTTGRNRDQELVQGFQVRFNVRQSALQDKVRHLRPLFFGGAHGTHLNVAIFPAN